MTPADLYRTCRFSARRLEVRQHYDVSGDEERQRAFRTGAPLPPPRPAKLDDLAHKYALRVTVDWVQTLDLVMPVHRLSVQLRRRKAVG